jgi:hypothetical protein
VLKEDLVRYLSLIPTKYDLTPADLDMKPKRAGGGYNGKNLLNSTFDLFLSYDKAHFHLDGQLN